MAMSRRDWMGLLAFAALVAAVALAASLATMGAAAAYRQLRGPSWSPPAWLFGPVWTLLYACIAAAGWMVWRAGAGTRDPAMVAFGAQLALNGLWSPLFFAMQWRGAALACILALDVAVAATLVLFWRRRPAAALLLVPYLLWVLFATALNHAYWTLNR